ncbi:MAG: amylo-alpha-1,6-glucosidase [Bacteroidales bacterium]|jgi:predicted glycogen debranching enzyme|nr:amylo-alpha-1,6-glucosidase [Bacteroidales bacterium]
MSYIEFNKEQLVNLSFSANREILRCSRNGSFATSTLAGLNTRKYHGLYIAPQPNFDYERYLLVSSLNEIIVIDNMDFRIGIQQFKGKFIDPKGNKYLQKFVAEPIPTYYFRVGKFNFTKEILFLQNENRLIIRYTILDDYTSATIRLKPLIAFRQIHELTHKNNQANTAYELLNHGVQYCLYPGFTPVCLQCSEDDTFSYDHNPVWYENIEYQEELLRGYDGLEDLLNPGELNIDICNKENYITIGTEPIDPFTIEHLFKEEIKKHTARTTFFNCLQNAAEQFIVKPNDKRIVIAGYPWFGRWGRDTFIALPGLTLALNRPELCKEIMDNMVSEMKGGLFPNIGDTANTSAYNSADAPLWFVRCLQYYTSFTHSEKNIWKEYGTILKQIFNAFKTGSLYNIRMLPSGLIYAGEKGLALTWMDAIVDGEAVTPRAGCPVEINGLWYNALKFSYEMAKKSKDSAFCEEWKEYIAHFPALFKDTFWSRDKGYLADYVDGESKNFQVRPNMMIVASLPYIPISEKIRQLIVKKTMEELLTERGIRTLSPVDADYKGIYKGNQAERDRAYHQGTCWVWLLAPFADALLATYPKSGLTFIEKLLYNFEPCMQEYGISTIAEIYNGDPPHHPNGAISQAWSVAALLYMKHLLETTSH